MCVHFFEEFKRLDHLLTTCELLFETVPQYLLQAKSFHISHGVISISIIVQQTIHIRIWAGVE